jgi:N6-L-threonylcarbamoyladenine synthase
VVPELASRDHIAKLLPMVETVLEDARLELGELDAIAYTAGPGLIGALMVGGALASSLAYALKVPAIAVHHLEGHILACMLEEPAPEFPFLALMVSGGHSQLIEVLGLGRYRIVGETLDDAAGEAFDKSAKLLGLSYPGGALLSKLADQGTPGAYELPRPMLHSGDLNFSFSGLKTAVLTLVREQGEPLTDEFRADAARAFQEAIVEVLVKKSLKALKQTGLKQLVVAGGVGANRQLRATLDDEAKRKRFRVHYPELEFCTDNGAMIALAGCLRLQAGTPAKPAGDFAVQPRWPLMDMAAGGTK